MSLIVFDIEASGLDYKAKDFKIHCVCTEIEGRVMNMFMPDANGLIPAIKYLAEFDVIAGHNIIHYDLPALKHMHYEAYMDLLANKPKLDTRVLSGLMFPEYSNSNEDRPTGHGLQAWGERLGFSKQTDFEYKDFSKLTYAMLEQCRTDVHLTWLLLEHLQKQNFSQQSIELEMKVAEIIQEQIEHGIYFNETKAKSLYAKLSQEYAEKERTLQNLFPPRFVDNGEFTPKKDSKIYCECAPLTRISFTEFNPGSKEHIAFYLKKKYNWVPNKLTPTGKPAVDEAVLSELDYPETKELTHVSQLRKLTGMLGDGDNAWLKLVKNNRIHGRVFTTGTVTGRMSHGQPNLAQVPSVGNLYGKECRELFEATPGKVLVGCDASGLELRCLAHFMARYDNGEYAKVLLEGDVHTENMKAAGLPTRNHAKTFIYAFLYGAGNIKIGKIIEGTEDDGAALKRKFLKNFPALRYLLNDVKKASEKGYIFGLDGRKLYIRSQHAALNTLLQSAGALIMKQALIIANENFNRPAVVDDKIIEHIDVRFVLNVHDEFQTECVPEHANIVGQILRQSIIDAGRYFNFRCPLDAEYKIGSNWAETH